MSVYARLFLLLRKWQFETDEITESNERLKFTLIRCLTNESVISIESFVIHEFWPRLKHAAHEHQLLNDAVCIEA
jgi:hypothetical protein